MTKGRLFRQVSILVEIKLLSAGYHELVQLKPTDRTRGPHLIGI